MAKDRLGKTDLFSIEDEEEVKKPWRRGVNLPGVGWVPRMSKRKSLYAILLAAASIDRDVDHRELEEIRALAERTKTLRGLSRKDLHAMQEKIEPNLVPEKIDKYVELATRAFRGGQAKRRTSTFMHALDILLADQILTQTERDFIKTLALLLRVPAKEALECVEVMMTKNAH